MDAPTHPPSWPGLTRPPSQPCQFRRPGGVVASPVPAAGPPTRLPPPSPQGGGVIEPRLSAMRLHRLPPPCGEGWGGGPSHGTEVAVPSLGPYPLRKNPVAKAASPGLLTQSDLSPEGRGERPARPCQDQPAPGGRGRREAAGEGPWPLPSAARGISHRVAMDCPSAAFRGAIGWMAGSGPAMTWRGGDAIERRVIRVAQ